MNIEPIDPDDSVHVTSLYVMLGERTPEQSISHKEMPTYDAHRQFVARKPYEVWYMITDRGANVGNIYITTRREVGIHISPNFQRQRYGSLALDMLRARHPGPLLANIAPGNQRSIAFFKRHGGVLIQQTYQL